MFNLVSRPSFDLLGSFFDDYPVKVDSKKSFLAPSDIYEKDDNFFVEAVLPGFKKEDINIELKDNYINISAENKKEDEIKEENYYKKEIVKGKFMRSFYLPDSVKKDKLDASFKDGILKIKLPKAEKVKPKQIAIN